MGKNPFYFHTDPNSGKRPVERVSWYDGSYYESSPTANPRGPDSGSARVFRGGSIDNILIWTTYRGCNTPNGRHLRVPDTYSCITVAYSKSVWRLKHEAAIEKENEQQTGKTRKKCSDY
jgi:formylglycine-generating enzyme required for sulfatase activity